MSASERRLVIGRGKDCDVILDDSSISRRHAELVLTTQGQWLLVDRHSQNGTSVKDGDRFRRISQEVIGPADTVQFGTLTLPASELLRIAQVRAPVTPVAPPRRAEADPVSQPWVRGKGLVRCSCGAVKPPDAVCPVCQR